VVGQRLKGPVAVLGLVDVMAHGFQGRSQRPAQARFIVDDEHVHLLKLSGRRAFCKISRGSASRRLNGGTEETARKRVGGPPRGRMYAMVVA